MSLAALVLVFGTIGATIASWRLLLMPAVLAGLYIAAPSLVSLPQPQDAPWLFVVLVAEVAITMGILARRGLSPE